MACQFLHLVHPLIHLTRGHTLFSLRKATSQFKGLTGVCVSPYGVSLARVVRNKDERPQLKVCAFKPCEELARQGMVLSEAVKEYALHAAPSNGVIEAADYSLLLVEPPNVPAAEIRAAVRWRIKDLINFPVDEAVIDVFDIPGQQAPGRSGTMYVVVARAALIKQRIDLLESAGLKLSVIDTPELALRNIAALLPQDNMGVALLHLTPSVGHITLTRQGSLYLARNVEVGMEQLVRANAGSRAINSQAEEDVDGLPEGLQHALNNIVIEVQRSLDYYESHYAQPPITQLVITPMAQEIPKAIKYLADNLGIRVTQLDLADILSCDAPVSAPLQARCLTAIGAALRVEQAAS